MSETIISISDVHKAFKDVKAVNGISFKIEKGEYLALLGPNGAGKTTLVEMIEGIQKPDSGDIIIQGMNWQDDSQQIKNILGISLQETRFMDKIRVGETLKLFASFYGISDERIEEVIEMVNLKEKENAFVENLSGGQRQRLALSIAMLNNPEVLILDEPTTGLDPTARRDVWNILEKLRQDHNTSMILTTHYMEEASYLCDRIIIMDKGQILARGTLDELLNDQNLGEIINFKVDRAIEIKDLPNHNHLNNATSDSDGLDWKLVVDDLIIYLPLLQESIIKSGREIISLECRKMTLDDLFISMTGRHLSN